VEPDDGSSPEPAIFSFPQGTESSPHAREGSEATGTPPSRRQRAVRASARSEESEGEAEPSEEDTSGNDSAPSSVPSGSVSKSEPGMQAEEQSGRSLFRSELVRFLELFAVCGLAVAQPLLDIYGKNAEEFVTRRVSAVDGVVFGLTILLVPPLVLLLVTAPLRLISEKVLGIVHHVVLAVLIGVTVVEVLKGAPTPVRWIVGLGVAVLASYLLLRVALARQWVRFLAPAPVIFFCLFLFASEASQVMLYGATSQAVLSGVEVGNSPPIVMLIFDELPEVSLLDGKGGIDQDAFPNFAMLARESTWYPNYSSVGPSTTTAVPAILTGRYPHQQVAVASKYPLSLFTILGGTYRMNVQESITRLCPHDLCARINTGSTGVDTAADLSRSAGKTWIESFTDTPAPSKASQENLGDFARGADGVDFHDAERLRLFENSLTDTPQTLNLLHGVLPHYPWEILPSGRTYESEKNPFPGGYLYNWKSTAAATAARERHLMQLKYTDQWLGRLITKMKEVGLWDKALIVVTADHGVSFQQGQPIRGVTEKNAYELMWCPLFMRGPGFRAGQRDERPVTSVDILPTIADVLNVSPTFDFDGVSALNEKPANLPKRYVFKSPLNDLPAALNDFSTVDGESNFKKVKEAPAAGSGGDDLHFFRTGPLAALIGQKVDQIPRVVIGGPRPETITVNNPGMARTFNPASSTVPAYVTGTIPGYIGTLLLTLNGVVVGSSTIDGSTGGNFWFLAPDSRMNEGENQLAVYSVATDGLQTMLRPFKTG